MIKPEKPVKKYKGFELYRVGNFKSFSRVTGINPVYSNTREPIMHPNDGVYVAVKDGKIIYWDNHGISLYGVIAGYTQMNSLANIYNLATGQI